MPTVGSDWTWPHCATWTHAAQSGAAWSTTRKRRVYADVEQLLSSGIEVVDVATRPAERVAIIEQAVAAGCHVLSQKPFATDLATARRLVALAEDQGVKLAVNQNGRWAPHWRTRAGSSPPERSER